MIKRSTLIRFFINLWPPYRGAGIKVKFISDDISTIDVEMKFRWWNRNYVKTQFGGSLYAMADPFFMMILIEHLGKDYIVWDKAATIRFKKPGRGNVKAHFHISKQKIDEIRQLASKNHKVEPEFTVHIVDDDGTLIAEVDKLLYVREKNKK